MSCVGLDSCCSLSRASCGVDQSVLRELQIDRLSELVYPAAHETNLGSLEKGLPSKATQKVMGDTISFSRHQRGPVQVGLGLTMMNHPRLALIFNIELRCEKRPYSIRFSALPHRLSAEQTHKGSIDPV